MSIKTPSAAQIIEVGNQLGMQLNANEAEEYLTAMAPLIESYNTVDEMPDNIPEVSYPRTPGHRPTPEENKHNGWYYKTSIKGAPQGKLKGQRVAIKDNICVAGVPMMNGASVLDGYVPDVDATLVTRILEAGGEIVGKTVCEYLCFSGGSHTGVSGAPVQNPWKEGYTTGGSSTGSGAVVAAGDVDMAIGCDQAGSVRIPASFCGIVGLKPTHGLVPYSGVMPIESTIDHAGPMTNNVANNALLLEAIAGSDGLDPRQIQMPEKIEYTSSLGLDIADLKIGILKEGFGHPNSEHDVDAKVREATKRFKKLGVQLTEISIPEHLQGVAVWTPIGVEGTVNQMMNGNGFGSNWKGLYVTSLINRYSQWRHRADELSDSLKYVILLGQYMHNQYGGYHYGKAQNIARSITTAYDNALSQYDIILMPTLPIKATPIPPKNSPRSLIIQRAHEMFANTAVFDITGHPALTIPCALSDGLPIGLMLVGKNFDEATIYRAAHAFEQSGDWTTN